MESYIHAKFLSLNKISVFIFSSINKGITPIFYLYKNGVQEEKLFIERESSQNDLYIYELKTSSYIEFGNQYTLFVNGFSMCNIDNTSLTGMTIFDELFYYDKDDLGNTYSKDKTTFKLWAPLAREVTLKVENNDGIFVFYKMIRSEKGTYEVSVIGDLANKKYHYIVNNDGVIRETNDPYGKAVSLNSEYSVVIDMDAIKKVKTATPKDKLNNYVDHIIYETNVRDFTSHRSTDIVNKGTYSGFVEEGRLTSNKNPAGLDYLKFLGVTTIQLQPVLDYAGVNDLFPNKSYNWGYDNISFFALEGSYSISPEIPLSRLIEFKSMVTKLHESNIRVVLDVVYNHVYDYANSVFEKIVPNYFFRRTANGSISNASGCGNDFKTERKMAQKIIIDSLKYLVSTYDVDGFRFDLMGLIDIATISNAYEECRKLKENIIFYGEGWDMGFELSKDKKASINNFDKLPNIAFFNDEYRNTMVGSLFKDRAYEKGFIMGNLSNKENVYYVFNASLKRDVKNPKFLSANQSINYIECHDNYVLFDKLNISNVDENENTILSRVRFANKLLILSFGVPFIHSGQEIAQSKHGNDNTYNCLNLNSFDYNLLDKRFDMALYIKLLISLRKNLKFYSISDISTLNELIKVDYWNNGAICFEIEEKYKKEYGDLILLINNEDIQKVFSLDSYYRIVINELNEDTSYSVKNSFIPQLGISLLKKEDI